MEMQMVRYTRFNLMSVVAAADFRRNNLQASFIIIIIIIIYTNTNLSEW